VKIGEFLHGRLSPRPAEMERAQRANSETGTGFACSAKLSGGQKPCPPVANAPVVRMTQEARVARPAHKTHKLAE